MRDDIRLAKVTTKPRFEHAKCKFYHEQIPKAAKMKRIPVRENNMKRTKVEKMSYERGSVVNFEHVT